MKTYFCRGKRMWKYPAASTIERLRQRGVIMMLWLNGDIVETAFGRSAGDGLPRTEETGQEMV